MGRRLEKKGGRICALGHFALLEGRCLKGWVGPVRKNRGPEACRLLCGSSSLHKEQGTKALWGGLVWRFGKDQVRVATPQ